MSAQAVYDYAPLGSVLRYSDGTPRPPERHRRKLQGWSRNNGSGRLVEKCAARTYGRLQIPASFTLHEGSYASAGVVVLEVSRVHDIGSALRFDVVSRPPAGAVLCLTTWGDRQALGLAASSAAEAAAWAARHPTADRRFERVLEDGRTEPVAFEALIGEEADAFLERREGVGGAKPGYGGSAPAGFGSRGD
jgi:hypothetical protein